jgi:DinB family protein
VKLTDFFAAQLDREAVGTRHALERVPEGRPDWKPHEKSMPLGYLATLVATMPSWIAMAITQDELDLRPPGGGGYTPPVTDTNAKLLQAFGDSMAAAREALRNTTDEHLATPWSLLVGGQTVMENPRRVVIADTFTHIAHHRGQLTVYLRLNGVPVPAIYGPSADDQRF